MRENLTRTREGPGSHLPVKLSEDQQHLGSNNSMQFDKLCAAWNNEARTRGSEFMGYAPLELNGKVAVVIGGTSGIGRALAHGLAEAGADVVVTSRTMPKVETVAREIEAIGRQTLRLTSDVSDRSSLERLLDECIKAFNKVDILINAAGRTKRSPTADLDEEEWNKIIDTNLTGTLRACQVFGRHMLERRYGRIINIASIASFVALQEVAAYCASKAAVASLTKSLAIEWAPHGICVNAIAPGVFPTDLNRTLLNETERGREFLWRTPMKRFGRVEELAGAAVFLASDAASFVTGEILVVDGGLLASGMNQ
jgi:NAD(P)-dependent dehydrogenase (short-subunit alcohol dehydrogenase family)